MNRHRELAQMMRSAASGGLGPNISHIEFTEGSGLALNDIGDAGLDADGECITTGTSWTTEQGKDVLVTANNSETSPGGWTQNDDLDSYIVGADKQWSIALHMCATRTPQYTMGTVVSKYSPGDCNISTTFYLAFTPSMYLRFLFSNGYTEPTEYEYATADNISATIDTWFKLVLVYDGTQDGNNGRDRFKVYIDGTEISMTMASGTGNFPFDMGEVDSSRNKLAFGSSMAHPSAACRRFGLESKWADYMFFDRVLSAAEVAQYQGGF